jgi:hypothetical protein
MLHCSSLVQLKAVYSGFNRASFVQYKRHHAKQSFSFFLNFETVRLNQVLYWEVILQISNPDDRIAFNYLKFKNVRSNRVKKCT